jgi:hypothetical protein
VVEQIPIKPRAKLPTRPANIKKAHTKDHFPVHSLPYPFIPDPLSLHFFIRPFVAFVNQTPAPNCKPDPNARP